MAQTTRKSDIQGHLITQNLIDDPAEAWPYVLYVDPDVHHDEWRLVRNAGLDSFLNVQDIRKLRRGPQAKALPQWLSVLPALVDTKTKMAYRGSECMPKLVSVPLPPEHLKRLSKLTKRASTAFRASQDLIEARDEPIERPPFYL